MSIITAVFQAIGQALTFIFPISESGHSAIFHNFAARNSGEASELTGLIHIGIALGILIAFYNVFIRNSVEIVNSFKEIFSKDLRVRRASNARKFVYFFLISFVPMLLYFIPVGKSRNLYQALHMLSYDGNLLSEGIAFLVTATLLLFASFTMTKNKESRGNQLSVPIAVILAAFVFAALPVSGLSLSAMVIAASILFNVNKNIAFRYFISISVPVLIVKGIIEIAICSTYVTILTGVVAVVVSAAAAYFLSKLFKAVLSDKYLKYFSCYNYAIGAIAAVTGIVQLIIK
ncbi:MAG: undecaprenyl-diphosphate phosphatase [Eubacterium sp.]|nr:undecaprenyl-diphosphate phosphatase [Eubacterium sp.]